MTRCINLRPWESRRLLSLAAGETAVLVRPVDLPAEYRIRAQRDGVWPEHYAWPYADLPCPFGRPGDTLIGREQIRLVYNWHDGRRDVNEVVYTADDTRITDHPWPWSVSALMCPKEDARHRLTIVGVAVYLCTDIIAMDEIEALKPHDHVLQTWDEKRFPWATSHAWVLTVRKV